MTANPINFKDIPVQASVISRIIGIDVNSNTCFQELDDLISSDQGVASLLLRVVNSPFYSRGNTIASIPYAISLLGFSVVRSLALMAFSRSLFSHTKNELFRVHIWQHSLLTALASEQLCKKLGNERQKDDAFVAGLMHDTGKVLMFTHDPALYEKVFRHEFEQRCGSVDAENKFFGYDHCAVGRQAVSAWKLPARFNDYMGSNLALAPQDGEDTVMVSLRAANYLMKTAGIGAGEVDDPEFRLHGLQGFGLTQSIAEWLLQPDFMELLKDSDTYKLCASI